MEKFLVKCLFTEYFCQKNILSIEIEKGKLLVKHQDNKITYILTNELTPEQREIKNYLEANHKKTLTWEELSINPNNPSQKKEPPNSYLP